jgi:argininosuccinate lyase
LLPVVVNEFQVQEERTAELLERGGLMATDLAEALVKRGVPFRKAHEIVGAVVGELAREERLFGSLSLEELKLHYPQADAELLEALKPERVLSERRHAGSTGFSSVQSQLTELERWLAARSA